MKRPSRVEQRRYVRLATILPVEFSLTDGQDRRTSSFIQGFTNNISKAGICLNVNDFKGEFETVLREGSPVALQITLPFLRNTLGLSGRITWQEKEQTGQFIRLRLGVEFSDSRARGARLIVGYALVKKAIPYVTTAALCIAIAFSSYLWLEEQKLIRKNTVLLRQYRSVVDELALISQTADREATHSNESAKRYAAVVETITRRQKELDAARREYESSRSASLPQADGERVREAVLNQEKEMDVLLRERDFLDGVLSQQRQARQILQERLIQKGKEKSLLMDRVVAGMYAWILTRQDLKTGLIVSYEGDDHALNGISYTYDQALAAIALVRKGEYDRVRRILDFYQEQIQSRPAVYNAYYTHDGSVNEHIVHAGVNAWVGLAAVQYMQETKDSRYRSLAEKISLFLESMMDAEGGLIGGPGLTWYSTEHNLDAAAFFRLMEAYTDDERYRLLSGRIIAWLDTYAYTRREIPVNRGKGDGTIATDTYAWSITALGPETLAAMDMDPAEIIDFAVEQCDVETFFFRKEGSIRVRGFDFSKYAHIARGGVISCEWTAQMILALQVMAEYARQQSDAGGFEAYIEKAVLYASELQKMIINAPSAYGKAYPTLPYASDAAADTGHGWRTPRGNEVGSLAATAYYLFAYEGWNPLQGRAVRLSLKGLFRGESVDGNDVSQ